MSLSDRYHRAKIKNQMWAVDADDIVELSLRNKPRYKEVELETGFPWWLVAIIHSLESDQNFRTHLHNGDSLNARTVQVPAGRPRQGNPPFTWVESAIDALSEYEAPIGLEETLDFLERYNGLGYRTGAGRNTTPPSTSPYLWSGTTEYIKGKYVADGTFDREAVSQQVGAAALLKRFENFGAVNFKEGNTNVEKSEATWIGFHRNNKGTNSDSVIVAYAGSKPVERYESNLTADLKTALIRNPNAKTFLVSEKPAPLITPEPIEEPKPPPISPRATRENVLKVAKARCSQGRSHSPGNIIDIEVLDPLRPAMQRLGQMGQSDNDSFYNWCASNVTKILRDAGYKVPDQPTVKGKPFWATVALVDTWKAWAIEKGAWRASKDAEPGDVIVYNWDGDEVTDHIGIILETRADGVLAAEGNKGNKEAIIYRDRSTFAGTINIDKLFS